MKNTAKRIVSLAAAFAVTAAVSLAVYAEDKTPYVFEGIGADSTEVGVIMDCKETYIVTIPNTVEFLIDNSRGKLNVSATGKVTAGGVFLGDDKILNVKISADSILKIENSESKNQLGYTITVEDKLCNSGDSVLSTESYNDKTSTLNFKLTDNPKYFENYSGTITFVIETEKIKTNENV